MKIRWTCPYECGAKGTADSYKAARTAEKLHVDVARLTSPGKHGKGPIK